MIQYEWNGCESWSLRSAGHVHEVLANACATRGRTWSASRSWNGLARGLPRPVRSDLTEGNVRNVVTEAHPTAAAEVAKQTLLARLTRLLFLLSFVLRYISTSSSPVDCRSTETMLRTEFAARLDVLKLRSMFPLTCSKLPNINAEQTNALGKSLNRACVSFSIATGPGRASWITTGLSQWLPKIRWFF